MSKSDLKYDIRINEYQRKLMLKVMNAGSMTLKEELEAEIGDESSVVPGENALEEITFICFVFQKMPDTLDDQFELSL